MVSDSITIEIMNSTVIQPDKQSETLQVEIERILPGGVGLAHAQGFTLFVALAAPGDVARIQIDRTRGKLAFASIEEIIKPSPDRVEPPCPYFGRCGGCDFQQLDYQAQLKAKIEIIRDCLRRIAHVENLPEIPIIPSPKQWHYRARANWQFDPGSKRLGYFEHGSHRVCDVVECAVLVPELQKGLNSIREHVQSDMFPQDAIDIEAAVGDEGISARPALPSNQTCVLSREIAGETYYFSAEAFFQINHDLLEPLVADSLKDVHGDMAIDLYCGVGLFTVPLARRFARVTGVEAGTVASGFARRNLRAAELSNAKIITARADSWLRMNAQSLDKVDFLLLDPPRSGAENGVVEGILALRPQRISYVSCDPATLARDLKRLLSGGYSLDSVAAFDIFPQTHHVETVVHLVDTTETRDE
jgi:23S rRNA (uracil1939-C5)-methyltransferase